MSSNQLIILFTTLCLTFATVHLVGAGGGHGHGHGHHGHGHHGHGHGHHGHGGRQNRTQCYEAQQFFNQWWPQTQLATAFQIVCRQLGATQAWSLLQGLLAVPVTGALDQTTFQALLNNGNPNLLAQQLFALSGGATTVRYSLVGK